MFNIKLLAIASLIFSLPLFANEYIALAKKVQGDVKVQHLKEIQTIKSGHKLFSKDVIITGENSEVFITFNDGSTMNLGKNSYLKIDNFVFEPIEEKYDFSLNLKKGVGVFESGKIGKLAPKSFSMKIPQGVIGIRGTKFLVDVD